MNARAPLPWYRPVGGLVLRAPLLPAADHADLATAGRDGAAKAWADPAVRLAVAAASPALAAGLAGGVEAADGRASAALQRYLIRATTRPTPYGGLASVAVTTWADATDLRIADVDRPRRTRPDMGWLTAFAERVASDPRHRRHLRVVAHQCVVERDGRFHLDDGTAVSVRATPAVRRVLAAARTETGLDALHAVAAGGGTVGGGATVEGAADGAPAGDPERAWRLLETLCAQRLLLPALLPTLIGDPVDHVLRHLAALPEGAAVHDALAQVRAACADLDAAPPAVAADALPALRRRMRALAASHGVQPDPGRSDEVQIDTALPLVGRGVHRRVADDVTRAVDLLLRLHPAPGGDDLAAVRAEFHRRYGDERRVPVLEVAGWAAALPYWGGAADPEHRAGVLRRLVARSLRNGGAEVVLDDALVERLTVAPPDPDRLAPSLELSVFLAARDAAAVDAGDYRLVVGPNLGAEAAGRGLGRFADLLGPPAVDLLREIAGAERHAEPVVAELVHRPTRARAANVAVRPLVRSHEIAVGIAPHLGGEAVVGVDELSVLLRNGRFALWWERAGATVAVTSGHMLNPAAAPAVGRLLAAVAGDGRTSLTCWDWGPVHAMPFLPRVRSGRVVVHPAQWRLAATDVPTDGDLDRWRADWWVPRHVHLTSADNRLLLDLDDGEHRDQLRRALRGAGGHEVVLQEGLPDPGDAWLPGPGGRHVVELVVPLVRADGTEQPGEAAPVSVPQTLPVPPRQSRRWPERDRVRRPGSDWLYLVLPGLRGDEDTVLTGPLGALADRLVESGDVEGWFFVRYDDPRPHLRMRLHGAPEALVGRVLPAVTACAARTVAEGLRAAVSLETYERELERYGGPVTTAVCERIACHDSTAVRTLLAAGLDRVELGVVGTAALVSALATGPDEARRWCAAMAPSPAETGRAHRERGARLRVLLAALAGGGSPDDPWRPVHAALARRTAAVTPLGERLRAHHRAGDGTQSLDDLVPSIAHLYANRLGLDRTTERLVLGLLDRTLRSLAAHPPAP